MAGFDKYILGEKLEKLGWRWESLRSNTMIPPENLWNKRPKVFHVYDARDLQDLLGEPVPEEDE